MYQRIESEHATVSKTDRKRLGLANKLALSTLSLAALWFSAGDSSAQHVIENNSRAEDTDRSNLDEIQIVSVPILETPFILNFAKATATPVLESTVVPLTPVLQPAVAAKLTVTEAVQANVNSELPSQAEPKNCPSGWPLAHGEITQGPRGATSHAALYPSEQAIDISADIGSPVFATFDGQVLQVNYDINSGYGIFVDIKGVCNRRPFTVRFAHLSAVSEEVIVGALIESRQTIGEVGDTGNSNGAHLHLAFINSLEMAEPNVPVTVVSFECDNDYSERQCGVAW